MIETTEVLALDNIVVDETIQPRVKLDEEHILELMEAYQEEQPVAAPTVWKIGDKYKLAEGFHRVVALKRLKRPHAEFVVRVGTEEACALDALCSNRSHGLKRSSADKRRCVRQLLKLKAAWSNPSVAKLAGVSDKLVNSVRGELEAEESIPKSEKRLGADGKDRAAIHNKPVPQPRKAEVPEKITSPVPKPMLIDANPAQRAKRDVDEPEPAAPVNRMAKPDDSEDSLEALLGRAEMWDESPLPVDEPSPQVEYARKADVGEPPIDPRFMPNAGEAADYVALFGTWKAKLNSLKSEVNKAFPEGHALASRIDVSAFVGEIKSMVERLDSQLPEFPCPRCCGTGQSEEGDECKVCEGYGITDREHYDGMKGMWKKSMSRYVVLKNKANVDGAPTAEAGNTTRKGRKHHAGNQPSVGNTAEQKP